MFYLFIMFIAFCIDDNEPQLHNKILHFSLNQKLNDLKKVHQINPISMENNDFVTGIKL